MVESTTSPGDTAGGVPDSSHRGGAGADEGRPPVFSDVDKSGVAPHLVAYLDVVAADPAMVELRQATYPPMRVGPGATVLDVGCGIGHAVDELADLVGAEGRVIGIDLSQAMVDVAATRLGGRSNVELRVGDVYALDLADGSVDAVRAERVFQHLHDPDAAVREVARVLRPGGRVVVLDPDWSSFAVDVPGDGSRAARISSAWVDAMVNPSAVLTLRRRLLDAGFAEVEMVPTQITMTDLGRAGQIFPHVSVRIPAENWPVPPEERESWLAEADAAGAADRFLLTGTAWTVSATR
jgi:SAM-dependent methyltransferase